MNFKKLNLCEKNELLNYIESHFQVIEKNENSHQLNIKIKYKNEEVLLAFYFNHNGTTTINTSQGKNKILNQEIANQIKKDCLISDKKNISFSLNTQQLPEDEFRYLLDFLKDDFNCKIEDKKEKNYTLYKIYRNNEKFIIKKYNNGTIQFQGKPINIYSKIIEYLSTIPEFSLENIIKIQTEVFEVPIEKSSIEEEFITKYPNSNDFLCDTTKKIIKSGIIQQKIDAPYPDYSIITYPFLRGLECTLKKIWKDVFNETITKKDGFKGKFEKNGHLKEKYKNIISPSFSNTIEKSYEYYRNTRHRLFHSDENPEMTKIIEDKKEAEFIIDKCNEFIERLCYETLQNNNR